ncbi:MAG: hypothetical protein ACW98D_16700 [Promethearchaeota archaeon]|jgi:hypothetical protein
MENKIQKANKIINNLIATNKPKVIKALKDSFVEVDTNISDEKLFSLIESEIIKGNGYLIFNLGRLIDKVYKTEPTESKSNGEGGGFGSWMSNPNNQQLVGMGVGLLGNLFNKGGDKAPPPSNNSSNSMMMQYQMAQQQAQQQLQKDEEERRRREEAQRSTNMMIFGGIGAVVVIGLVVFMVTQNKGKVKA